MWEGNPEQNLAADDLVESTVDAPWEEYKLNGRPSVPWLFLGSTALSSICDWRQVPRAGQPRHLSDSVV